MPILTASISQMVPDMANFTIANNYNVTYDLAIGTFTIDLLPF